MKLNRHKLFIQATIILAMFASCTSQKQPQKKPVKSPAIIKTVTKPVVKPAEEVYKVDLPTIKREFRGAWIATVANINWPTKNNLSVEEQKAEAIKLLDLLKDNNFNAVIFQVRPSADALYKSSLEPWSYFLTGETGREPYPFYDPLEFWVAESHKRGLEFHAWLNPYRAHHSNGGRVTSQSMVNKMPDHIIRLRNGMYWMDPAAKETQDHVSNVVKDLVKRYNIDAIHFDDYFYPYATYNGGADFPDSKTWNIYKNSGGDLSRADWRRDNVNRFVERIYKEIKTEKSYVKFGISPFGIWKPGYPEGIRGSSQYDELYADAKLWLNKGWVDYYSPQLYWPINSSGQSFPKLLSWWKSENTQKRNLWPGLNTVEIKAADRSKEIVNQVKETRQIINDNTGVVHWSIAGLTKSTAMQNALKTDVYQEKVLIPKSPWMTIEKLETPKINVIDVDDLVNVSWSSIKPNQAFQWVVYSQYNGVWETEILTSEIKSKSFSKFKNGKKLQSVAVKAIDRLGNESDYAAKKVK